MISFRYHVFTIVAIFLAVALGIAVGNAYVQPALVDQLRNRTDVLANTLAQERAQNEELTADNRLLRTASDILPSVDGGALTDRSVTIVTQDGASAEVLTEATTALEEANADLVAVLSVTDKIMPPDDQPHPELAQLLGMPTASAPADVARAAADALAERLVAGPSRRQPGGADLLDELLRGQYLRFASGYRLSEGGLARVGGKDQIVVVVTGSTDELALAPQSFSVPLAASLVRRGGIVAAGEPALTADPFVEVLRGTAELDGTTLVTVDDLGYPVGGAALVLGLERVVTSGQGGDYGARGSAEAKIPPVS